MTYWTSWTIMIVDGLNVMYNYLYQTWYNYQIMIVGISLKKSQQIEIN